MFWSNFSCPVLTFRGLSQGWTTENVYLGHKSASEDHLGLVVAVNEPTGYLQTKSTRKHDHFLILDSFKDMY